MEQRSRHRSPSLRCPASCRAISRRQREPRGFWACRLGAQVAPTVLSRRPCSAIAFRSLSASSASTVMAHHPGGSAGRAPSRVAHQRPPSDTHGRQPGNSCVMADSSAAVSPRGSASRDTSDCGTTFACFPPVDRLRRGPARPATECRRTGAGAAESMHELARNFRQARAAMMSRRYSTFARAKLCRLASQRHWPLTTICYDIASRGLSDCHAGRLPVEPCAAKIRLIAQAISPIK